VPQGSSQADTRTDLEPSAGVFEPGAASIEPEQAVDENPGADPHRAWVESIWSSP
jgi:hypothetical protein